MKVATQVATLRERFGCLHLNALCTLADIVEARESTINIGVDLFPGFDVEHRVTLRDFADDNPVAELTDLFVCLVRILGHGRGLFVPDRAHIVVVAMVDIGFFVAF